MKISVNNSAEIGSIIRLVRLSQGLDQAALAGLSGVGPSFLSHAENGKETAQIGKVLELFNSLGIRFELTVPPEVADFVKQSAGPSSKFVYEAHVYDKSNELTRQILDIVRTQNPGVFELLQHMRDKPVIEARQVVNIVPRLRKKRVSVK